MSSRCSSHLALSEALRCVLDEGVVPETEPSWLEGEAEEFLGSCRWGSRGSSQILGFLQWTATRLGSHSGGSKPTPCGAWRHSVFELGSATLAESSRREKRALRRSKFETESERTRATTRSDGSTEAATVL